MFLRLSWLLSALIPSSQRALKSPVAFFKGGDISQLGGDFVLGPGELALVSTLLHGASICCRESLFLRVANALDHRSYVCCIIRDHEHARSDSVSVAFIDVEVPDLMAAAGVPMPK